MLRAKARAMPSSTTRSSSAPANSRSQRCAESDDEPSEFPPLTYIDNVPDLGPAWWTRQVVSPRSNRQSRASSIVSTRTRFSTTTLDEVRSIEINAGGNTYRISRDGSHVTDLSAPPPYADYEYPEIFEPMPDAISEQPDLPENDLENAAPEPESRKRVRIVLPGEEDDINQKLELPEQSLPSDRVLTKADLYQLVLDLPLMLKQALGMSNAGPSSLSNPDVSHSPSSTAGTITKRTLEHAVTIQGSSSKPRPHSSDDVLLSRSSHMGSANPGAMIEARSSTDTLRPAEDIVGSQTVHMTVGDLNELSVLYNGVIRDLDREHRRKLHERDKEMERLRSLLNEKDIVYRQQLKAKDFIIEEQRRQMALQDDQIERKLEMARNEVEDDWEKRWKVQEGRLLDRLTKAEEAR